MTAPLSGAPRAPRPTAPSVTALVKEAAVKEAAMKEAAVKEAAVKEAARKAAPGYRVSVADKAVIVERGERRRKWFVREGNGWVRVSDFAGAVLEADEDAERCPAGVVWQRRYELTLPRGSRLMAVSTFPRVAARSTLWYLSHGMGKAELVYQQRQYVVVGNYRLIEGGQMQERVRSQPRPEHSKAR